MFHDSLTMTNFRPIVIVTLFFMICNDIYGKFLTNGFYGFLTCIPDSLIILQFNADCRQNGVELHLAEMLKDFQSHSVSMKYIMSILFTVSFASQKINTVMRKPTLSYLHTLKENPCKTISHPTKLLSKSMISRIMTFQSNFALEYLKDPVLP